MTDKQYSKLVKEKMPKSPLARDCGWAFVFGGAICMLGQFIMNRYAAMGLDDRDAATCTSITLVALSALLTGLSVYDDASIRASRLPNWEASTFPVLAPTCRMPRA